jgi:hypothetical protein
VPENEEEQKSQGPRLIRHLLGVTMRASGVSVTLEKETVGDLTERYIDDEQRSERRSAFFEAILSLLGLILGLAALAAGGLPLGGNAIALVAGLVGLVGIGLLTATWSIAHSVQRRARAREEQPLSSNLLDLREQLGAIRQPLLERSVSVSASKKEA